MYEDWRFDRWETPISDFKSIGMVSLVDNGALCITVEAARDPHRPRWEFRFERAPIYQNILGEYRLELWGNVHSGNRRYGPTVKVPESPWLKKLKESEALIDVHSPGLIHFQIATEDDVIDIASADEPRIISIAAARSDDPAAGKSEVLYANEDRDKLDAILRNIHRDKSDT